MVLEFNNICKKFGDFEVLKNISFKVESGKACAYLGRNGAGKTTSIRALMNVFRPDSGEFLIDKQPFDVKKHKIGYLPEERGMYNKIPILDQLIYFAELRGISKAEAKKNAMYYLEKVGLTEYSKKELGTLSKGNQQKIQLIQTVIHQPEILILDEPFSGLDPVNSKILQEIVMEYINAGAIVFLSSHQMSLIEEICEDIIFIKKGEIVGSDSLQNFKSAGKQNKIRLKINNADNTVIKNIFTLSDLNIKEISDDSISSIIEFNDKATFKYNKINLLEEIIRQGLNIKMFSDYEPRLSDIYIKYLGNEAEEIKTKGL